MQHWEDAMTQPGKDKPAGAQERFILSEQQVRDAAYLCASHVVTKEARPEERREEGEGEGDKG